MEEYRSFVILSEDRQLNGSVYFIRIRVHRSITGTILLNEVEALVEDRGFPFYKVHLVKIAEGGNVFFFNIAKHGQLFPDEGGYQYLNGCYSAPATKALGVKKEVEFKLSQSQRIKDAKAGGAFTLSHGRIKTKVEEK